MKHANPIRAARQAKRLSLQAFADQIGVSKTALAEWERGEKFPRPHNAMSLIKALPRLTLAQIYTPTSKAA